MSTDTGTSKEQLEAEILALRTGLGETVEALSKRLDVKSRAKHRARTLPVAPLAILSLGVVALVVWRRRS